MTAKVLTPAKPAVATRATETATKVPSPAEKTTQPPTKKRKLAAASPKPSPTIKVISRKAEAPKAPRAPRTRKSKAAPSTPPAPAPVKLSLPLLNKIRQVHAFLARRAGVTLECDSENKNLISVPQLDLVGAIERMWWHWETFDEEFSGIETVREAIVDDTIQRMVGDGVEKFGWVTIDIDVHSAFERRIKEKIPGWYGLEAINLVAVELRLMKEQMMKEALGSDLKFLGNEHEKENVPTSLANTYAHSDVGTAQDESKEENLSRKRRAVSI
ncbi:uncharacterized protein LTR77_000839 [Saxophila tyrrhenica]|uniref:Uncharacterized protein n=1 Tax=Saxophila tyrrhenica TaxID=1690608 RepID=A0AAV9PTN3_9PEZI|nr:hypothetical protein LTR77_000839 [Saxophila tyrrhenica]